MRAQLTFPPQGPALPKEGREDPGLHPKGTSLRGPFLLTTPSYFYIFPATEGRRLPVPQKGPGDQRIFFDFHPTFLPYYPNRVVRLN